MSSSNIPIVEFEMSAVPGVDPLQRWQEPFGAKRTGSREAKGGIAPGKGLKTTPGRPGVRIRSGCGWWADFGINTRHSRHLEQSSIVKTHIKTHLKFP